MPKVKATHACLTWANFFKRWFFFIDAADHAF
jgi:hypothetical protein